VVITGAGDHHDLPEISTPIRAVYFETTLVGEKRTGHLWEHTHGKATPVRR
jgi:mannose-6-phosphate isomerase-like protein (cupin superfamily)